MRSILVITKKELSRFWKDKRLFLALFLPGILIYVIYSFLGGFFVDMFSEDAEFSPVVYVYNLPASFKGEFDVLENTGVLKVVKANEGDLSSLEENIKNKDDSIDALVCFPDDFAPSEDVANKQTIRIIYNSTRTESSTAYQIVSTVLNDLLSTASVASFDYVSEKDMTAMIFSMVAPMLLLVFMFAGCSSIVPESFAGEKERGTLGAMLVTPVKRSYIAAGKISALSVLALLSGICSFLGLYFSLPKLLEGSGVSFSSSAYTAGDFAMMLFIVLSAVLFIVAVLSLVSVFAKSVKEATSFVGPMMIAVMLIGASTIFTGTDAGSIALYLIPIYNSVRALGGIFSFAASPVRVAITCVSDVIWTVLLSLLLSKMLDNDKIVFEK